MFLVSLDDLGTSELILISLISKFVEVPRCEMCSLVNTPSRKAPVLLGACTCYQ